MTTSFRINREIKSSGGRRSISSSVVRISTVSILLALATPVFSDTRLSLTGSVIQTGISGFGARRSPWVIQRALRLSMASGQ